MADTAKLLKLLKRSAVDAVKAEKLTEVRFGKVISAAPLKISVEQKMTLGAAQLVLCRNVTDFEAEISVGGHSYVTEEKKKITVCNGLAAGDEVILLRQQGGQKYIVWDRLT